MNNSRIAAPCAALLVLGALALPASSALNAQESAERAVLSLKRMGIGFGFHDAHTSRYLRDQRVYAGFADVVLMDPTVLRLQSQYSQSDANVYAGHYSMRSTAIDAVILAKVSKLSSLGIGVGANWIKFKRHSVVTVYDDPNGSSSHTEVLDVSDALLRPSLLAMASSGWVSVGEAGFELALTYQWTFLGGSFVKRAKYSLSSGPLNTIVSLGATAFISFDLGD